MTSLATRTTPAGAVLDVPLFARALHGETVEGEYRVATIDGQTWWLQWSEAPLRDNEGSIQGAVAWVQDLTPYERVAGAVPQATPIADAHAECRELVATLSHDLKNPLTRIKGQAQLQDEAAAFERLPGTADCAGGVRSRTGAAPAVALRVPAAAETRPQCGCVTPRRCRTVHVL